jgi:uncharacterized ferritin-like protein (DUF455 family)
MNRWAPFHVLAPGVRAPSSRSAATLEGRIDRLRSVAFAELQAKEAFLWAADQFAEAEPALLRTWRALAAAEARHYEMLVNRLTTLGGKLESRGVSDGLWHSLTTALSARDFALKMATAEDRGRAAGEYLVQQLAEFDPETAAIFGQIAIEERDHIQSALQYFPDIKEELFGASSKKRPFDQASA